MPVQDEVRWVLDTIKTNWPEDTLYGEGEYGSGTYGSGDWPNSLYRVDRDEPEVLETGERTKEVERTLASVIGASLGSRIPEVAGPDNRRRVTTTVDCRFKGLTDRHRGHIESNKHAKQISLYAQHAIQQELSYPEVDPGSEDIGRVAYHTTTVTEPTNRSQEWRDEYFWTWSVELVGYETI